MAGMLLSLFSTSQVWGEREETEIGTVCLLIYLHLGFWKGNSDLLNCLLWSIQGLELCGNTPPFNTKQTNTLCSELPRTLAFKDGNICRTKDLQALLQIPSFCGTVQNLVLLKTLLCLPPVLKLGSTYHLIDSRGVFYLPDLFWLFYSGFTQCFCTLLGVGGVTHQVRGYCSLCTSRVLRDDWGASHSGLVTFHSFPCSLLDIHLATCSQGEPVSWEQVRTNSDIKFISFSA